MNEEITQIMIIISYLRIMFFYEWFIKTCCLFKFIFLHEQYMCHIQSPYIIIITKFHTFSEYFFYLGIIFQIPIYFGLCHQYRYVSKTTSNLNKMKEKVMELTSYKYMQLYTIYLSRHSSYSITVFFTISVSLRFLYSCTCLVNFRNCSV